MDFLRKRYLVCGGLAVIAALCVLTFQNFSSFQHIKRVPTEIRPALVRSEKDLRLTKAAMNPRRTGLKKIEQQKKIRKKIATAKTRPVLKDPAAVEDEPLQIKLKRTPAKKGTPRQALSAASRRLHPKIKQKKASRKTQTKALSPKKTDVLNSK